MKMLRWLAVALACGAALAASAQSYPTKPITVTVPFAAGGPTDTIARIIGERMSRNLGQTVVVENVAGAGGTIAGAKVAHSAPDGYTVAIGHVGTHVIAGAVQTPSYDVFGDFEPVGMVAANPQIIVSKTSVPAKDLKEFIAWVKANAATVSSGTGGPGTPSHVSAVYFSNETGVPLQIIHYKGSAPALQDVIGGQVEITSLPVAESMPLVRSKRVKAIGQTGTKRSLVAPEVPTLDESGIKGYSVTTWYVVFAPAKLAPELVTRIYSEIDKVLKRADTQERFKEVGVDIIGTNPTQAAAFVKSEYEKWAKLIQASGAKVD